MGVPQSIIFVAMNLTLVFVVLVVVIVIAVLVLVGVTNTIEMFVHVEVGVVLFFTDVVVHSRLFAAPLPVA